VSISPQDPKNSQLTDEEKRAMKFIKWVIRILAIDVIVMTLMTIVLILFGQALIMTFIDPGTAQTMGSVAWFFVSLCSSICFVVVMNFIAVIVAAISYAIHKTFAKRADTHGLDG
jgi:uncharacterized membrane protein